MDKIEFITEIRHACWVSYQIAAGQPYNVEMNNDQRVSLRDGVQYMIDNPDITSEQSHNNWMKMKTLQDWRWGPVKDFDERTHPNLVSFDNLPDVEKLKDVAGMAAQQMAVNLWNQTGIDEKMSLNNLIYELSRRGYAVVTIDKINDVKDIVESWKP